eukprot:scaffold22577_cov122-Cylindrotheca_fusiformis.AAC.46
MTGCTRIGWMLTGSGAATRPHCPCLEGISPFFATPMVFRAIGHLASQSLQAQNLNPPSLSILTWHHDCLIPESPELMSSGLSLLRHKSTCKVQSAQLKTVPVLHSSCVFVAMVLLLESHCHNTAILL